MFSKLLSLWIDLKGSLWFVPGLMIAASILLAIVLVEFDASFGGGWEEEYKFLFGVGADGSRGMLTAIGGSMLTVAALAFSLTLNAITQASAQFTPRIYRNFLRDRVNQFILGYFVSVFAYCLVVLRSIRGGDENRFVPSFSVFIGLLLALGGILVLIYFIHHIAASLQISNIISDIVDETKESIEDVFPKKMGEPAEDDPEPLDAIDENDLEWAAVPATSSGYMQVVDSEGLLEFAEENELLIRMEKTVGDFVGTGSDLVSIAKAKNDREIDDDTVEAINDLFGLSRYRTIEQDVGFGIRQLVDIALKALSPGVNDTTTAINCIDNLGELIGELASRQMPARERGRDGRVYVIAKAPGFVEHLETAFDQIRISGRANQAVFERLTSAIDLIGRRTDDDARLAALERQLNLIGEYAEITLETNGEKMAVFGRIDAVRERLAGENPRSDTDGSATDRKARSA